MKKYQFFQWVFFYLLFSIISELKAQYITYPVNGSVFQQNSSGKATVNFSFSELNNYNKTVFYRIKKADGTIVKNRVVLNSTTFTNGGGLKGYRATELLDKGWYTVEFYHEWQFCFLFICGKPSNRMIESKEFGVGDIYFAAGQSNASGFNDQSVDNPITFSSQNSLNIGGNYINHSNSPIVRTFNFSDFGMTTKGLPDANGFVNLTKSEMPIYPNGVSSWCWAPLGNEFANHNQTPTMFFNVAVPNTSLVYDWVGFPSKKDKNSSNEIIGKFYQTLGLYGNILGAKSVLWHQGERDSQILAGYGNPPPNIITNYYNSYLGELIDSSRIKTGLTSLPWFVSKVSYTSRGDNISASCVEINTTNGYKDKYDRSDLKSFQVKNGDSKVFQGVTSDFIDDDDWEGNAIDFNNSTTECVRAPMQRIHFSGDWLGKLGHAWYKAINTNYAAALGNEATQLININSVSKAGNNFTFTVAAPPSGATIYYWCKGDAGINNSPSTTAPTSPSITLFAGERLICYAKDNTGRYYASQPYIRNDCSNCRPGGGSIFSISPTTLNFVASGETKSLYFTGSINDWEITNAPSWITDVNWDDINQKLNITSSNNTGLERNGIIEFKEVNTGNNLISLSISQTANSTCTQTNLSSLTPINPSSERQGYGTMQNNLNISGQTLMVGGYQTTNGIGTHANSRIVYNLGGQYNTFTGSVGRDDAADNCNCGTMKTQFVVKADGDPIFTSNLMGTADGKQDFSLSVSGKSQLELIVNDGGDNIYGDHADWLDAILYCGSAPTCTSPPPPPINVSSSPSTINSGSSSTLSATCSTGTVLWSTGATGNTLVVSPTITTTYNAKCISGTCPESTAVPVSVTVNSSGCSGISDNLEMGTWTVTNDKLVARFFHGQYWLTQRAGTNPEVFVVRGSAMLQRSDVNLTNSSYYNMINCFGWIYSNWGNLGNPSVSTFPTPSGFSLSYLSDGTMVYTANTGGGGGGSCTDTYVSNNWASATIGDGTPKIGFDYQGGTMTINGTNYTQGIGTHANSEIVYNLGSHSYTNFKASVGRDESVYGCNCGTGRTIIFKVYNQSTGELIPATNNPITKGDNQAASEMVIPIAGVSSIRLVVEDGGDQIWGDWANWANARFTCPTSSLRKSAIAEEDWFWISPNPNDGKFIAKVKLKASQKVVLYLTNTQGKAIKEYSFEGMEGENSFEIQIPNVQDQVYNLRCQAGEESSSKRIVIQK